MGTACVGENRLDGVTVADHRPHRVRPVRVVDARVMLANGLEHAGRHTAERLARELLAVGKTRRARLHLHGAPQRLLRQLLERAARPGPVAAFAEPVVGDDLRASPGSLGHDLRRLQTALQRAARHEHGFHACECHAEGGDLLPADIVEGHAGGPAGENSPGVGCGPPMADEEARRHETTLERRLPRTTGGTSAGPAGGVMAFTAAVWSDDPCDRGQGHLRRRGP